MGGSGGYSSSYQPKDVEKLEDIARKEIEKKKEQQDTPRRRVFISFQNEDLNEVNLFRGQAKNENSELDFIDSSIRVPFNSENAEYIKRGIRDRIDQCSVTVVFIGEKTHKSEWVDWEIRESIKRGKGVIAVKSSDDPSLKIPKAIKEYNLKVVPWKHAKIKDAIDEAAVNRTNRDEPDGS
jgi:hypothetical protein